MLHVYECEKNRRIYLQLICFANYMHQTSEWVIRPLNLILVHEIIAAVTQIERWNLLHCFATAAIAIAATAVECSFTYYMPINVKISEVSPQFLDLNDFCLRLWTESELNVKHTHCLCSASALNQIQQT